jgi:uncharacterized protein YdaU (DUF1376 family)
MHYYKFNINDWQASVRHLTPEQEGVYFRLINYYYDTEKPLPLDMEPVLRRLMLETHWVIVQEILAEFFIETSKGYQKEKCDGLIKEYKKMANKNKKNGVLGGRPRKNAASKKTQSVTTGNPLATQSKPTGNPNHKPLTTNHKPLTTNQIISEPKAQSRPKPKFDAAEVDFIGLNRNSWLEWIEYRKEKRKPVSKAAAKKQTDELLQYDEATQALMIDQSIKNDYTGIFPLKVSGVQNVTSKPNRDGFLNAGNQDGFIFVDNSERAIFAQFMDTISDYYQKPKLDNHILEIYFNGLATYTFDQVKESVSKHMGDPKSGQFMPKIADIKKHIEGGEMTTDNVLAAAREPRTPFGVLCRIQIGTWDLNHQSDMFYLKQRAQECLDKLPEWREKAVNGGYTDHEIRSMLKHHVNPERPFHSGLVPPAGQNELIGRCKKIWLDEFADKDHEEPLKIDKPTKEEEENIAKVGRELITRLGKDFGLKI